MQNENVFKIVSSGNSYHTINPANMETYLSAAAQVELLETMVIGPFEDQLKKDTGFGKNKIPKKRESIERRIGNHMFYIDIKPTTKPKYGEVFNAMTAYIDGLKQGRLEGRKRDGVRTIDGGSYVSLDDLMANLDIFVGESMQPSAEFSIRTSKGKRSKDITQSVLQLDYSRDYGRTEGQGAAANARDYIEAKKIVNDVTSVITKPFEASVRNATGFGKDNIPSEVIYTKTPVGNVLCYCVNSPAENISYGKVMADFKKYLAEIAEETKNPRSAMVELRRAEGKDYVNLSILHLMLNQMKESNTATTIRQNISYLRRPKDDKIIVE